MTTSPPDWTEQTPSIGPEPQVEDSAWVHAVVSAALLQANIPEEQATRVLNAATAEPADPFDNSAAGPFSTPPKPQADDWPDLKAAARVDATKARLEAERPSLESYLDDAPALSTITPVETPVLATAPPLTAPTVATPTIAVPPLVEEPASTTVPRLDAAETPFGGYGEDEVLAETDASTEGYRQSDLRTVVEWLVVCFLALVVAVLAKEFVVQAFWIPSESMETTVNVGDRVLVNKLSYQFNDVRRGDLVVFAKVEGTQSDTEDLIKRAVALPGETLELRSDGRLWIWGPGETPEDALLLDEPYLDVQNALLNPPSATDAPSATIWHESCVNDGSNLARCTLDDSSFFMMGDNRSRSLDSRGFGPVPEDNIIGRAFFRIWPLGAVSTL